MFVWRVSPKEFVEGLYANINVLELWRLLMYTNPFEILSVISAAADVESIGLKLLINDIFTYLYKILLVMKLYLYLLKRIKDFLVLLMSSIQLS